MSARIVGIARHARPRGPVECLESAEVTVEAGVRGDFRGAARPGSKRKRQITVMAAEDWAAAMDELGHPAIDWSDRRVNLLTQGIPLPREAGMRLRIGNVVLEITGECDPCPRMEEVSAGLRAVLTPDWRGGRLTRVIAGGHMAIGDPILIEESE
jgi:MOSC domain-containing protein YiiM